MSEIDPFVRRPLIEQMSKGDFTASNLMHMIHYQVSAEHMVKGLTTYKSIKPKSITNFFNIL